MSTSKTLVERIDVDNADIPEIIERAERLRQRSLTELERENHRSSVQDVKLVGRDLSIPDEFIEQAIAELRTERHDQTIAAQQKREERQAVRSGLSTMVKLIGVIVAVIVCLRGTQWLWFALDFTSAETSTNKPEVIVEERVIRETVIQTVTSADEEPVRTTLPLENKNTSTKRGVASNAKSTIVSAVGPVSRSNPPKYSEEKSIMTVPELPAGHNAVDDDEHTLREPAVSDGFEKSLSHLGKKIEGEWILDAYLLYEQGVSLPMEVPVVYEPLELPKTWRFTSGKYKRVMDSNLSFTARFEVGSLPDSLRPAVEEKGEWGQLIASNVVSTIPGIRRQNDYFAFMVTSDALTIWYLGPNAYRKKLPSQAERYRRR